MNNYIRACTALMFALAGCSAGLQQSDVVALLQANDPKVCANENVQQTVLATIDERYNEYIEKGGEPLSLNYLSASGVNEAIHEVSCSAALSFEQTLIDLIAENAPEAKRTPLEFSVKPSLADESAFVVSVNVTPILKFRLGALIERSLKKMKGGDDPQIAPLETQQPSSTPTVEASIASQIGAGVSIWRDGADVSGTCRISIYGEKYMMGPCSGAGHGSSVFVTAEADGCSIELTRDGSSVRGRLFAYKNTCGSEGSPPNNSDVDLGTFRQDGRCLIAKDAEVCLDPS